MNGADNCIICPFYIEQNKCTITCEGIKEFEEKRIFETPKQKKEFTKKYCASFSYRNCEHARKLNLNYGD